VKCGSLGFRLSSQSCGVHYSNFDISKYWPQTKNFQIVDFASHAIDSEKICVDAMTPDDAATIERYLADCMYLKIARDGLGMIMHRKATKSTAVEDLALRWAIAREDIVAFGDDMNDIDMLAYAGIGVAVANALEEVKSAADTFCGDCDGDGVAKWLEENVLR
jgi:hydroxymethylpyrimidine pyrophosphatase-like HAD family hydrolase